MSNSVPNHNSRRGVQCALRNRAALYVLTDDRSDGLADLMASAAAASLAGFHIVAMAYDDASDPAGAPKLCALMERLGEGAFDAIYGRAEGRDVVIELDDVVRRRRKNRSVQ